MKKKELLKIIEHHPQYDLLKHQSKKKIVALFEKYQFEKIKDMKKTNSTSTHHDDTLTLDTILKPTI